MNLGKSKVTPAEDAARRLRPLARPALGFADYVTVNVSSPNTPGLRDLQATGPLGGDPRRARRGRRPARSPGRAGAPPPVLVKIAPDLAAEQVDAVVNLALARGLAGMIVSNTTLSREGLASPPALAAAGGRPLGRAAARARDRPGASASPAASQGRLVVVGVGGVFTADDAWDKLAAGASLVQVYTGLRLRRAGHGARRSPPACWPGWTARACGHVSEIVGSALRPSR